MNNTTTPSLSAAVAGPAVASTRSGAGHRLVWRLAVWAAVILVLGATAMAYDQVALTLQWVAARLC